MYESLDTKRRFGIEHFSIEGYKLCTFCPHALKGGASNLFLNKSVKLEQHLRKSSEMVTQLVSLAPVSLHVGEFDHTFPLLPLCVLFDRRGIFFPQLGKGKRLPSYEFLFERFVFVWARRNLLHMSRTSQSCNINYLEILCHPVVIFQS